MPPHDSQEPPERDDAGEGAEGAEGAEEVIDGAGQAAPGIGSTGGRAVPNASLTCSTSAFVDFIAAFAEAIWLSATRPTWQIRLYPIAISSIGNGFVSQLPFDTQIRRGPPWGEPQGGRANPSI